MESKVLSDRRTRRILAALQENARVTNAELGRRIGLSPTAVADRIRDLENDGVIRRYATLIEPAKVGLPIVAMVSMSCDGDWCRKLASEVEKFPEVVECHRLTGDFSALLKVTVASINALEALVDQLSAYGKPSTSIVLSSPINGRGMDFDRSGLSSEAL